MVPQFDYGNNEINAEFAPEADPEFAPIERRTEFNIPADNYGYFLAKFGKLSRKAKKLGQPIDFTVIETFEKKVGKDDLGRPVFRTYYKVHCDAQPVKVEGYTFVATIDHMNDEGNIVRSMPNTEFEVPESFRTAKPFCQHCNSMRIRRNTFLLREDATGNLHQIGKNCLADFIGRDPASVIARAEWLGEIQGGDSDDDFDGAYGMRDHRSIDTLTYLEHVATMIRVHGWMSAAMAKRQGEDDEFGGPRTTKDRAHKNMHPSKDRKTGEFERTEPRTDEDRALAKAALEWAQSLETRKNLSDYEHNICVLAKTKYIEFKSEGFVASIVSGYLRVQEKLKLAEKRFAEVKDSQHVGEIGDRLEFTKVRVVTAFSGITRGGWSVHRYSFATPEGNVLEWSASSTQNIVPNTEVSIRGTVVGHNEYQGVKRTKLTRCKVGKVAA